MVNEKIVTQRAWNLVTRLQGQNNIREGKYITNYSRYMYNGTKRDDLWSPLATSTNYWAPARGTVGIQTQFNLTKSVIDTIISKISQANVRPYFNSVNGDYDTRRLCDAMQRRFDAWLDQQHAYPKSVLAFRDACIFDMGVLLADPERQKVYRVQPWKYFLDPAEYEKGFITQMLIWEKYFPYAAFKESDNSEIKKKLEDNPMLQGNYARLWDLYNGYLYEQIDGMRIRDPIPIDYQQEDGLYSRPTVEIFYTKPVKGFLSRSLADDEYPIQRNIDLLIMRQDEAFRNAINSMIFVPSTMNVKSSTIENGTRIYTYDPGGENLLPTVMTPPAISEQFLQQFDRWVEKGYEIAGISQLSAQSKKPAGLDSGKALDTMEDIESERFNTQLQQFVHLNVELVQTCIDVFPKGEAILGDSMSEDSVTWGDARKARNAYRLQFSAADSLSKDPEEKRAQIDFYLARGWLDDSMAADMMHLPDLERAETIMTASSKHIQRIIYRAIHDEDYDYDEVADLGELFSETVKQLNILCANGDKKEYIDRCKKLLAKVKSENEAVGEYNQPPAPPQPPPEFEPLKDYALDSGQIQGIVDILTNAAMQPGAKAAILTASFPKIPPQAIQAMIQAQTPAAPVQGGQNGSQQPGTS